MKVLQAADVMTGGVFTIAPEAPVTEAAKRMIERRVSALPVVDRGGRLVGIVSEGDLVRRTEIGTDVASGSWLRRLVESGARDYLKTKGATVRDVMSKPVISVRAATPLREVARLLDEHRIKRLPVVEGKRLVGIVARADLVRQLASAPARPAARNARDRKLREQVLEATRRSGAEGLNLNVTVDQGVVHLWGDVRSRAEQRALSKSARSVEAVREVEDHTRVIPLRVAAGLELL